MSAATVATTAATVAAVSTPDAAAAPANDRAHTSTSVQNGAEESIAQQLARVRSSFHGSDNSAATTAAQVRV